MRTTTLTALKKKQTKTKPKKKILDSLRRKKETGKNDSVIYKT